MSPSNPSVPKAALDERRCTGCRLCLPICDAHALIWVTAERELFLDGWACTGCGDCVRVCPEGALSLAAGTTRGVSPVPASGIPIEERDG